MDTYTVFRLAKFAGLALFCGGVFTAVISASARARMAALGVTTLGLAASWGAGYGLMKLTSKALKEPWIGVGMLASLMAFHMVALLAHKARPKRITGALTMAALFASILPMVAKSNEPAVLAAMVGAAIVVGGPVGWMLGPDRDALETPDPKDSWRWFTWVARFEGASVILLFLIYMPLKHGAGIALDGGNGLVGWVHGVLFVAFLQALWSTGSALQWSWGRRALGVVASLVPFGTFVFEYRVNPGRAPEST